MYSLNITRLVLVVIILVLLVNNINVPKLLIYLLIFCLSIDVTKSNVTNIIRT